MYEGLSDLQPVILAGGTSSRMGYNKVFAKFGDSTLIETIYTLLDFSFEKPPIIITNDKRLLASFEHLKDARIYEDEYPNHKTLGATATALKHSEADNIFVIGVDMPFISLPVLEKMAAAQGIADLVVPIMNQKDICLHSIYSKKLLPIMEKKIQEGNDRLHSFFGEVTKLQIPIDADDTDADIFIEINTPEDLAFAQEHFEEIQHTNDTTLIKLPE